MCFYQYFFSHNEKILNLKFSRRLGLNFAYIPLNSVSVKNWNSLKYLSTKRAKEGTCTHSVCFNDIFRSDAKWTLKRCESSAKSSFLYNSSLGHLHMKDFCSVKNEIVRKWVIFLYSHLSTLLSTLCDSEKICRGRISWICLSVTKTCDLTYMNNFFIKMWGTLPPYTTIV